MKIKKIKGYNKPFLDAGEKGGLKITCYDIKNSIYKTFLVSDREFFDANFNLEPFSIQWKAFLHLRCGDNYLDYLENKMGISYLHEEQKIIKTSQELSSAIIITQEKFKEKFVKNKKFFDTNVLNFANRDKVKKYDEIIAMNKKEKIK